MSEYQLKLRATDDGNPPLSTTLEITIKLLDINDNDPTFKTSNYYTTIREDIEIGTVIFPDLKSMVVDQIPHENLPGNLFIVFSYFCLIVFLSFCDCVFLS